VLGNDTDVDSDASTLTAVLAAPPSHGSLVLNADGSFTYTPAAGFAGSDSFAYYAKDVTPLSSANVAATVTLTVSGGVHYTAIISPLKTRRSRGAVPVSWKPRTRSQTTSSRWPRCRR
jgi:VCBS repeat-containing protein